MLSSVRRAPVRFKPLELEHAYASPAALTLQVSRHFQQQLVRQFYALLGSSDLLGNVTGFTTAMRDGLDDALGRSAAPGDGAAASRAARSAGLARNTVRAVSLVGGGALRGASRGCVSQLRSLTCVRKS